MPSVVPTAADQPRSSALRVTIAMSGPGVIVSSAATPRNGSQCAASTSSGPRGNPHPELGADLVSHPFARLHRSVHVAVPDRRCLGAGPVHVADRLAKRGSVGQPDPWREDAAIAAARELLPGPQHLHIAADPADRMQRLLSEVPREALDHALVALMLGTRPPGASVGALDEPDQHTRACVRRSIVGIRRVVEGHLHRARVAGRLPREAAGAPERVAVQTLDLDRAALRDALVSWSRSPPSPDSAASVGSYTRRPASVGGIATIACLALTSNPSPIAWTLPPSWTMRRTGAPRRTREPSRLATAIEIACEPPMKRLSCAPLAVSTRLSKVPADAM